MPVRILASAEQDLLDGYEFYESQQQSLGTYFLDSLFALAAAVWPLGVSPKKRT